MKKLILLGLAAITFGVFGLNFAYAHHEGDEYWYDEYWEDDPYYHYHHYDHHWVYYPHGYYCVYYVWYHPWWWDWYWYRCHWCHNWDWHFFGAGYYVVWYEGSHWYWRPRYGRYVRYELPYGYNDFKYKAREHGISLPDKPPRQIDIPYNEKEVVRLTKEKDPDLYKQLEKEEKSGNLEKMRKEYEVKQRKEIEVKNEEYRLSKNKVVNDEKNFADKPRERVIDNGNKASKDAENRKYYDDSDNGNGYSDKARDPNVEKRDWSEYYDDEDQNKNDQGNEDKYDKPDDRRPERDDSYERNDNDNGNSDREKENNNNNRARNNRSAVPDKGNDAGGNTDNSSRDRTVRPSPGSRR